MAVLRRLGRLAAETAGVLAGLLVAVFLLVHLVPGDPARRIAGIEATGVEVEALRKELGLDQPLAVQFVRHLRTLASGELGRSFLTGEPVAKVIADRLPKTLYLAAVSVALMLIVAVPMGLIAAGLTWGNRNRAVDLGFTVLTSLMGALPSFLLATFLAFIFAVWLGLLPVAGATKWNSVVLPALAIALRPMAELARMIRVETLNVLAQDYIRTARAKRLRPLRLYGVHVLPNVLTAALTLGGLIFAHLIGGTVVIENVFAWPGLGTALVQAILARDYPTVQGVVLLLGCSIIAVNALVDLLLTLIDPRVTR
jgi:peptide/nickel transport system permease protein